VLGATAQAKTASRRASGSSGANGRGARSATRAGNSASDPRRTRSSATAPTRAARRTASVDRDALLQTLFPNGIPARESLIRELNSWLDQAEQLAQRS